MKEESRRAGTIRLTAFRRLQFDFGILAGLTDTPLRNPDYLERLIEQEQRARDRLRTNIRNLLILNSFGLSLIAGTAMPIDRIATFLPDIPAATEILVLLIGVAFAGYIVSILNLLVLHSFHIGIVAARYGLDAPWLPVQHLDGLSVWTDLSRRRQLTRPTSGFGHRILSHGSNLFIAACMLAISIATVIVLYELSAIVFSQGGTRAQWAVALCGIAIALFAVVYFGFTTLVRLEFLEPEDVNKQ